MTSPITSSIQKSYHIKKLDREDGSDICLTGGEWDLVWGTTVVWYCKTE